MVTLKQFEKYMEDIKNHLAYHQELERINIKYEEILNTDYELNIDYPLGVDVAINILEDLFNDKHYLFLWIFDSQFGFFPPTDFDKSATFKNNEELYYFLLAKIK